MLAKKEKKMFAIFERFPAFAMMFVTENDVHHD